ncbi:MAG TPA: SMP-30/gluconolactonase/LRE family protein [Myxococcaceae bacterium]|nr:SMP-30/gluconolactonase/LRE family protein [Myxococcaceae bacterium]
MSARFRLVLASAALLAGLLPLLAHAQVTGDPPFQRADAIVDLRTRGGAELVKASWRFHEAHIVPGTNKAPGPDLRASGAPVKTQDLEPHAGAVDFDDRGWEVVDPPDLEARRGNGKVSFGWYRLVLTVPERIGSVPAVGSTLVFEVVVDDYAEVWVDGKLPAVLGQSGGGVVRGFNAPSRVVLTRDARPGQTFHLAVFAMNGPVSVVPTNFLWFRSATLDVYRSPAVSRLPAPALTVERKDPALDSVVPPGARPEALATGFGFTEGPVWSPEGDLLFSDPNENTIYRWSRDGQVSVFRTKSGYAGIDISEYKQPGSNGLTFDAQGRLTVCQHGERRVIRIEPTGAITVLADRYQGKRLNSPNDLVYRKDGTLYFTDPPFGLPKVFEDPRKELAFSGVYRVRDGQVTLVAKDLTGPNGLAFSPDEKYLYVTNWDEKKKVVMRYPVAADGSLGTGSVFFDMTAAPGEEALDGMKVDAEGHLLVSGPGGVWVISGEGKHLGTLRFPELPANMAWGDADGRTLYFTARTSVYRLRLGVPGIRPVPLARVP